MDQRPEISPRIGTFFILVGILLLILFLGSCLENRPRFDYGLISLFLFFLGYLLRRRAAPGPSSNRFTTIHRLQEKGRSSTNEKGKQREE